MEKISVSRAINWFFATVFTTIGIGVFFANVYIAYWFYQMAVQGTPHEGSPPLPIIQRGLFDAAPIGLWLTVLLWWFIRRKRQSYSSLFATKTGNVSRDMDHWVALGSGWV